MKLVKVAVSFLVVMFFALPILGEDYQRFDGEYYNGLYYPRIDMIAWGEPLHLEFQIYDKKNKIDIVGKTLDKNGQGIFLVAIDLSYRGERRCRRIIAPPTFKPDQKLYYYYDNKDKDMNNVIVSAQPLSGYKVYLPPALTECQEVAAHSPIQEDKPPKQVADRKKRPARTPAASKGPSTIFDENNKENGNAPDSPYDFRPVDSNYDLYTDRNLPKETPKAPKKETPSAVNWFSN